jgi:hypothetical protein
MDADLYEQLNTTITSLSEAHPDDKETQVTPNQETDASSKDKARHRRTSSSLPQEFGQVVDAISASPWAARLGSLVGNVRKQLSFLWDLPNFTGRKRDGNDQGASYQRV